MVINRIIIKNTTLIFLYVDINKNLKTLKKDKKKHGFGLKNIKKIVDKYNGNIGMDIKDKKFITQITLILEN